MAIKLYRLQEIATLQDVLEYTTQGETSVSGLNFLILTASIHRVSTKVLISKNVIKQGLEMHATHLFK